MQAITAYNFGNTVQLYWPKLMGHVTTRRLFDYVYKNLL